MKLAGVNLFAAVVDRVQQDTTWHCAECSGCQSRADACGLSVQLLLGQRDVEKLLNGFLCIQSESGHLESQLSA